MEGRGKIRYYYIYDPKTLRPETRRCRFYHNYHGDVVVYL